MRRRRAHALPWPLLAIGFAAIGCGQSAPSSSSSSHQTRSRGEQGPGSASRPAALHFVDPVANPVVDERERSLPALRIVSAAPSVTEICCALGLRDCLVGRTRYCTWPPGIESVPAFGALLDVNLEVLLAQKPDLVLVAGRSQSISDRLAALNLRCESLPDVNLPDVYDAIRRAGALCDRSRTAARLCAMIEAQLAQVAEHFAGTPPARVLILTGVLSNPPRPPYVAGPGSFYGDLLALAGHTNAVAEQAAAFAPLSLEFISRADPDVIIELDPDGAQRRNGDADAREIWRQIGQLSAVEKRRVHVLKGGMYYLLGPRIAQVAYDIHQAIAESSP